MKYTMERAVTMKMGPNNARHIIWASGEFFKIKFCVFYILIIYTGYYLWNMHVMMKTSPNNASGIVWASGEFFK